MKTELRILRKVSSASRSSHVDVLQRREKSIPIGTMYVAGEMIMRWTEWEDIPIIREEDL